MKWVLSADGLWLERMDDSGQLLVLRRATPADTLAAKLGRCGGHSCLVDLSPEEFAIYLGKPVRWVHKKRRSLPGYRIISRQCHVINLGDFQHGEAPATNRKRSKS